MSEVVPYVALILAGVFVWAGVAKLLAWRPWRAAVGRYHLGAIATPVAVATPVAELALAWLILTGPSRLAGVACIGAAALFSLAILRAKGLHGQRVPCGCFGGDKERDFRTMLVRNLGIGVLGALLAIGRPEGGAFWGGDAQLSGGGALPFVLALLGVGLGAWLLYEAGLHLVKRGR